MANAKNKRCWQCGAAHVVAYGKLRCGSCGMPADAQPAGWRKKGLLERMLGAEPTEEEVRAAAVPVAIQPAARPVAQAPVAQAAQQPAQQQLRPATAVRSDKKR